MLGSSVDVEVRSMPRAPRIQYENAFYHVMNRGRGRRWVFHGDKYYEAFLACLEESHDRFDARIHAYCLMGNHYHLLVETPLANLDRIMRHINGVYTQRYNRLKRTDGPLFRGRYKAVLVDEDAYLLEVSRYIHRNPLEIKGASSDALSKHEWSSYLAYINKAAPQEWLSRNRTYRILGGRNPHIKYEAFVLKGNDARTSEFYGGNIVTSIYGDLSFRQSIYDDREYHQAADGLTEIIDEKPEMVEIVEAVAETYGISVEKILTRNHGRQSKNLARQVAIYCCQRKGLHKQKEIAEYFSLSHRGSVSSTINAVETQLESVDLIKRLNEISRKLNFTKRT